MPPQRPLHRLLLILLQVSFGLTQAAALAFAQEDTQRSSQPDTQHLAGQHLELESRFHALESELKQLRSQLGVKPLDAEPQRNQPSTGVHAGLIDESDEEPRSPVTASSPSIKQTAWSTWAPPTASDGPTFEQFQAFSTPFARTQEQFDTRLGINLFQTDPDFSEGIVIWGPKAAMKIGGYVKADLIQDFDAIDSDELFDTGTIPIGAPDRQNTTFHARSSRLNFDGRWQTQPDLGIARAFVEVDFFSAADGFRLRHAYGELGEILAGQTWSTFTDVNSLPTTLDFEGSASVIQRRQAQIRWTRSILSDNLTVAIALENPQEIIEVPPGITGDRRTESPDLVSHLHYATPTTDLQFASVVRKLGFQPTGMNVESKIAWGLNLSGRFNPRDDDSIVFQIHLGEGIGSYRGLPDAAPISVTRADLLPVFGWMIGWTHLLTDSLQFNFTYSEAIIDNLPAQSADALHSKNYLAANMIWQPTTRVFTGIEYLYGQRVNFDGQRGDAHRLQASFGFYLP